MSEAKPLLPPIYHRAVLTVVVLILAYVVYTQSMTIADQQDTIDTMRRKPACVVFDKPVTDRLLLEGDD